ncbi:vicilin-like antimicrobial peptides 2-2 [Sesamum indicum]|uniref:Vicilin-like antimicrobial peptides 2-2 n=1 Tax=Sesamum indicum TaxID=4182 RepID=A0A6I9U2B6_SESIN|nr:vicilin-like antimicrobial peptides 2-2 [Sesamum indicum]
MAMINLNTRLSLLLLLTLSLLLLPSHCYTNPQLQEGEEESAEEGLFKCFVSCEKRRENEHELSQCEKRCVREYQERKREEREERGGRRGEETVVPKIDEPRKVYEQCLSQCGKTEGSRQQFDQCRRICERQYEQQQQREKRGGGEGTIENHHRRDPEQQYKQCQSRCAREERGEQRQYCQQKCQWEYERQKREQGREQGGGGGSTNPRKEREEEEEQEGKNPYFFESQRFDSKYRTEEGNVKVLERFSKKSELLQGVDNYRLAVLEANPNTFVLPHHFDAESVLVVAGGKGTISYVWQNRRKSYNVKLGDVMRVPAGSIVYLVNRDDNEKLYVLKLLQPVNTPGRFKEYFGVGGENPESFYRTFSNEILEAAFNVPSDRLKRLFGQQKKGVIIRASKEQIRALSQESEESSRGRREESWGPFNLLEGRPLFSNRYGQYFEASPNDYQQLKDLDVSVGFMNINKGGMVAPYYNSRSTKLVLVVGGNGRFEMACPHRSARSKQGRKERQGETTDVRYQRVSARLSIGDAFIVPAGHPIAMIASQDSNLQLVSFGIKGSYNQKYFLAGQDNIWNQVESEAKELSFKMPAREVEEIFRRQEQSYFLPGPGQGEERGKEHYVASILDFVGF